MKRRHPVRHIPWRTDERAEFGRLRRRLTIAMVALLAVLVVGVVGYSWIGGEEHDLIDAIYMTVITLTTVGYGEIIDMSANHWGRVFTMSLLLVGMGIVAYSVPMVVAFAMEGQLLRFFARGRMEKLIAHLDRHMIVCGDTPATWYAAEELLKTQRQVVVVAPADSVLKEAFGRLGEVPSIAGDPTEDDVLLAAGIEHAAGVVLCMESDKDNALAAITARRLAPHIRIVASTEHPETEPKLRAAGADAVVSPSRTGGLRIASELVRPKVVTFLDQMLRDERSSLRLEEVTVAEAKDGRTVGSLGIDQLPGAVLLALRRRDGSYQFKPAPETPLEADATLIVMADASARHTLEHRLGLRARPSGVDLPRPGAGGGT